MTDRLDAFLKFYEKDPDDSFVIYGIALEYISRKDFVKAEDFFNLLLTKDPNYVAAYMQYAMLKSKLNQANEAKELYKEGIKKAKIAGDRRAATEMESFLNELE